MKSESEKWKWAEKSADVHKNIKYRNLMILALRKMPNIQKIRLDLEYGDVVFDIPMDEIGLGYNEILNYKKEVFSPFFADFMGELFVRENMDKFANFLVSIDEKHCAAVNRVEHEHFGLNFKKDHFIFSFHASFLRSLLTESFKAKINEQ